MDKPKVINHRSSKGSENEVYIGRGSKWGNPFTHYPGGTLAEFKAETRDESIDAYGDWILTQPELMATLPELRGKTLVCWCKPDRCHGEILLQMANPDLPKPPEPHPSLF